MRLPPVCLYPILSLTLLCRIIWHRAHVCKRTWTLLRGFWHSTVSTVCYDSSCSKRFQGQIAGDGASEACVLNYARLKFALKTTRSYYRNHFKLERDMMRFLSVLGQSAWRYFRGDPQKQLFTEPFHPLIGPVTYCLCMRGLEGDPICHSSLWFLSCFVLYYFYAFNNSVNTFQVGTVMLLIIVIVIINHSYAVNIQ